MEETRGSSEGQGSTGDTHVPFEAPYRQPTQQSPYGSGPPPVTPQTPYTQYPPYGSHSPQSPYAQYPQTPYPYPAPTPRRRSRGGVIWAIVAVLVIFALALTAGLGLAVLRFIAAPDEQVTAPPAVTLPVPTQAPPEQQRPEGSVAAIAAEVLASTVYIEAQTADGTASGTGVVLREDGYLVTNNHVIAGAATAELAIRVTFPDGQVADAEIVGRSEDYDLAVLRVGKVGLKPLVLANSDAVVVGDPVIAVGAPLGLQGTVTTGIVSALNRAVTAGSDTEVSFINAIQTDAAINPGNSGGPLVNMRGEVIGINTAIAQPPGTLGATGSIGLGFAIPSNQVARTTAQLIELGYATYPILGVLLDGAHRGEGVLVAERASEDGTAPVTPGGPGDQAGVKAGDVILRIDGRPVTSSDEVIVMVRSHAPGDVVVLSVRRGTAELDIPVTLGERRAN